MVRKNGSHDKNWLLHGNLQHQKVGKNSRGRCFHWNREAKKPKLCNESWVTAEVLLVQSDRKIKNPAASNIKGNTLIILLLMVLGRGSLKPTDKLLPSLERDVSATRCAICPDMCKEMKIHSCRRDREAAAKFRPKEAEVCSRCVKVCLREGYDTLQAQGLLQTFIIYNK